MKQFYYKIGMALCGLVLGAEKRVFWYFGYKLPMLRKYHRWQSVQRQKALDNQKLLAV